MIKYHVAVCIHCDCNDRDIHLTEHVLLERVTQCCHCGNDTCYHVVVNMHHTRLLRRRRKHRAVSWMDLNQKRVS